MDRDNRWERIKLAYDAIVHGTAAHNVDTTEQAVQGAYDRDETDEFIAPTIVGGYDGAAPDEPFLFANFRPDRARELSRAIGEPEFEEFSRGNVGEFELTTMTQYRKGWPYPVAFPPREPDTTLAEVISEAGRHQIHVAETEKYAHVTYFFNGGREAEWEGEERRLVPSPRDVPTYDLKPEMSAGPAADAFIDAWKECGGDCFGIINFANPDMVGHTGDVPAAIKAIETVDANLGRVVAAVQATGGACLITADHGNAEQMREPDGSPNTAHSTNPVPFICTVEGLSLHPGILADVAPTALDLLGIPQPEGMTGATLRDAP
jgi:2,3-bisphosphoglycerate-independent phosphoglycerate mutase